MRRYQSLERIRGASVEELAETESMNLAAAEKVYTFFHSDQEAQETAVEERPQI